MRAFVLGGFGGIGHAVACALKKRGIQVVLSTRREDIESDDRVIYGQPSEQRFWDNTPVFDETKDSQNNTFEDWLVARGPIRLVFVCTGSLNFTDSLHTTPAALHDAIDAHVTPALLAAQYLTARPGPTCLAVLGSDPYSTEGTIDLCQYVVAKHALAGLAACIEEDAFGTRHRVEHFEVGNVDTPLWSGAGADVPDDAETPEIAAERMVEKCIDRLKEDWTAMQ